MLASVLLAGTLLSASAWAITSDDFNTPFLKDFWTLVDPLGDGSAVISGAGTGNAKLLLSVPAGRAHDPWTANDALRVMQPAADTDFAIQVKFDSPMQSRYQDQGIIVEGSANNWMRFDVYSDGSNTRIFAATIVDGKPSTRINQVIAAAAPIYLKVNRTGSTWILAYSYDGLAWSTAVSFSHALAVTAVGPYAGNHGTSHVNAPAHTAVIDYFFNTANPIVPEDGAPVETFTLGTFVVGSGTLSVDPDLESYLFGQEVVLTATPAAGYRVKAWTGTDNDTLKTAVNTVTMTSDKTVTVEFEPAPQVQYPLTINVTGSGSVVVNPPGGVYAQGTIVTLTAVADPGWLFSGWTGGVTGQANPTTVTMNSAKTVTAVFAPIPSGAITSDDFNTPFLKDFWTLVDPLGDGSTVISGAGTGNAKLLLSVPAGRAHDPWTANDALRVMQPAANANFNIEVKFDSPVQSRYQDQGIIVEGSANNWMRFDVYSDGSNTRVFAATIVDGKPSTRINQVIAAAAPIYLKVNRAGNTWTLSYSYDGQTWSAAGSFSHSIAVTAVGPYAGNHGTSSVNAPAHTAVIDYFFNAASPIVPEDGASVETFTLGASVLGSGTLSVDPDLESYPFGQEVILTATPAAGYRVKAWTGTDNDSLKTTVNTVTMTSDKTVRVEFEPAQQVQYPLTINVTGAGSVVVNPPGGVYAQGTIVTLTAVADPGWLFSGWTGGVTGQANPTTVTMNSAKSVTAAFAPASVSEIVSDDFNRNNLDLSLWDFIDPVGDSSVRIVGAGTGNAQLLLSVPAGRSHDPWNTNNAVRVMQPAANTNFSIEVKFDSPVQSRYQDQGIIVEGNANNWMRFDIYSDGSNARAFAATVVDGKPSARISQVIAAAAPIYLKVNRAGNTWTLSYSYDGLAWSTAGSFSHSIAVTAVGPYAGNDGTSSSNAPAHTAVVDYFFNTAAPVVPEDAGIHADLLPPFLQQVRYSQTASGLEISWLTDEQASSYIEYGATPELELGLLGRADSVWSHAVTIPDLSLGTVYFFRTVSSDAQGLVGMSEIMQASTGYSGGPIFNIWYGTEQRFGSIGIPQRWVNILGNVADPDGVRSLSYSLNGGPSLPLSLGPDNRRLAGAGDFNVELDYAELSEGANTVVLTAVDSLGNRSVRPVTVHVVHGNYWPENYSINWSTVANIQNVAQVVDGLWKVDGGGVRPVYLDYDRVVAIGDIDWDDYEVTVPITVHGIDPSGYAAPSNGPAVGLGLRWAGHTAWDDSQPRWGFWPIGALALYRWQSSAERFLLAGNEYEQTTQDSSGRTIVFGLTYMFKVRVETLGNGNPRYSFKFWKQSEQEPPGWDLMLNQGLEDPSSGSVFLLAHHVDAVFGNVVITAINGE